MNMVRHLAIMTFFALPLAAINPVFADSMLPEGRIVSSKFNTPMFQGKRLDWCRYWAKDCGKPAADAWCRSQGFETASEFLIDENIGKSFPTKVIGTGQICNKNFCDGFKKITCYRYYCPAGAKEDCCYGKAC
ncbi:MAG: hypothetical protein V8K32_06710 [Candidatus Electrothrix gigas]